MPGIYYIVLVEKNSRKMFKGTVEILLLNKTFYQKIKEAKEWNEKIDIHPTTIIALIKTINDSYKELNSKSFVRRATDAEIEEYEMVNR